MATVKYNKNIGWLLLGLIAIFGFILTVLTVKRAHLEDPGTWSAFEEFVDLEKSGIQYSCDSLIGTSIIWKATRTTPDTTVSFLDYQLETGATFKSCETEIDQHVNEWCSRNIQQISMIIDFNSTIPVSRKASYFCSEWIKSAAEKENDSYQLPTEDSPRLTISAQNKIFQINPQDLVSAEYSELIENYLWGITLKTANDTYKLFMGDKARWQKAQTELKALPLTQKKD